MPFTRVPGLIGKVFVPEKPTGACRKHDCPDCYACQMCSDDRCAVCRTLPGAACRGKPEETRRPFEPQRR